MYVNCVLTEHLAGCERFKYISKCKVAKSKIKSVLSSLFELPFLYLPNVFIHEPNEFIHVRVVNKLSKFKFTMTLWCLHPGHCYSSTHLLYNFVHYIQFNQFGEEHFFVRAKGALQGPDLAVPYRAFSSLH